MKLIVITSEKECAQEADALNCLFAEGLDILHLRKPMWTKRQTEELLRGVDPCYRNRIVLHDQYDLILPYGLRGAHLNSRSDGDLKGAKAVSRSCHSFEEVTRFKAQYEYIFLSPVFDSISKAGYSKGFSDSQLVSAAGKGIIDSRVVALGGIDENNISRVGKFGFGGAAVLGYLWSDYENTSDEGLLISKFRLLRSAVEGQGTLIK